MRFRDRLLTYLGLCCLVSLGSFACQSSKSDDANDQEATSQSPSERESSSETESSSSSNGDESSSDDGPESTGSVSSESEAPPKDLYPGFDFGRLAADDRSTFVSIAKAELCPCDGVNKSLHACLQSKEAQCSMAKRLSAVAVSQIRSGRNKTDVRDRMAQFLEKANKEYSFNLENAARKGPKDAPVKIVEFADFQCPHCKEAAKLLKETRKAFDDDQVAQYFKYFPLSPGGMSRLSARAAEAARQQGRFWPMHDLLFEHQRSLSENKIMTFARQIGLNFSKFKRDLQSQDMATTVESHHQEGKRVNIRSTPTIFINGQRYMGGQSKEALVEAIRSELEATESSDE